MQPLTVLVCDDAMFMRTMLGSIVSQAGYDVIAEASNGREAIAKYEALRPDIILMDMVMPEVSGVEAVRAICEIDPDALIVMCSAMGQQRIVAEAIQAGAKGFIVKPFNAARVIEALADVTAKVLA